MTRTALFASQQQDAEHELQAARERMREAQAAVCTYVSVLCDGVCNVVIDDGLQWW